MNMHRLATSIVLAAALGLFQSACGDDSAGGGGGGDNSCDIMTAGIHTCIDYGTGYPNISTACTAAGGTASSGCSHSGSNGGCKVTSAGYSETTWYYGSTFTASTIMTACAGGTFVSP